MLLSSKAETRLTKTHEYAKLVSMLRLQPYSAPIVLRTSRASIPRLQPRRLRKHATATSKNFHLDVATLTAMDGVKRMRICGIFDESTGHIQEGPASFCARSEAARARLCFTLLEAVEGTIDLPES
jgi:hypothetical protein